MVGSVEELMAKKPPRKTMYRWRIARIRGTPAVDVGTVEALDAETAIKTAIEKFEITNPEHQKRLVAQRRD